MDTELETHAREYLKSGLAQLPENCHRLFRAMYAPGRPETPINDVVDSMPTASLDNAVGQVRRTLAKRQGE